MPSNPPSDAYELMHDEAYGNPILTEGTKRHRETKYRRRNYRRKRGWPTLQGETHDIVIHPNGGSTRWRERS